MPFSAPFHSFRGDTRHLDPVEQVGFFERVQNSTGHLFECNVNPVDVWVGLESGHDRARHVAGEELVDFTVWPTTLFHRTGGHTHAISVIEASNDTLSPRDRCGSAG